MPRESSKCREWEKERRNRLNEAFQQLCKLLPCYDPTVNTSKIDILRNATKFIEELQEKLKELTTEHNEEKTKTIKNDVIKKLQERLKRLLSKNEQLCSLLRDAKITIPPGCAIVKKFRSHLYWSNRITPEQAKILQDKELEKENTESKSKRITNKKKNSNTTPKHRKVIVNRTDKKTKTTKKRINQSTTNCLIVLSKPPTVTQPCYVITNAPSNALLENTSTVLTNTNLLTTPLVTTNVKNFNKPTLGPGTLILANGTILPVLPPPPPPTNQTVILLPKVTNLTKSTETTTITKTLPRIKPKYCLTRTTQANKVPIPALTSKYANNELILKKTENKSSKDEKKKEKSEKRKSTENNNENSKKAKIDDKSSESSKKIDDSNGATDKIVEEVAENEGNQDKNVENVDTISDDNNKGNSPITITAASHTSPTVADDGENSNKNEAEIVKTVENVKEAEVVDEKRAELPPTTTTTTATTTTVETTNTTTTTTTAPNLELNINHSELSNDIFATLQVPSGCQNPESTSPTAAFLLAFPLVSSLTGVKVTEVTEEDNTVESQRGTPTLLQIGTMDTTKPTQSDNLTPNLLNLDNLSFFSSNNFYNYDTNLTTTPATSSTTTVTTKQANLLENHGAILECPATTATVTSTAHKTKTYPNYTPQTKPNYNHNNFDDLTTKITSYPTIIKNYPDPLYTNSNTYNYNYNDNNFNQNYYKNLKSDNRNYYSLNYENYNDYRKNDLNFTGSYYTTTTPAATATTTTFSKEKCGNLGKIRNDRPPVNWMTTPDYLPQITKDDYTTTNTFTTATTTTYFNNNDQENRKNLDLGLNYHHHHHHHHKNDDDNQFAWSPTKLPHIFEPTTHSFVTSTLPTLVGDLSLNNSLNFLNEPKTETKFNTKKENRRNNNKYENQSNFLSVSQLVDHNKSELPARTTNRRNSGNRSKKLQPPQQHQQPKRGSSSKDKDKNQLKQINYPNVQETDLYCDNTKNHRNLSKNYSAEALISHQNRQNYPTTTTAATNKLPAFLPENPILPYFPSVDLQSTQDNNYMQQNQNYSHHHHHHHHHQTFGHNFSSGFQNNNYTNNGFIPPPPPPPPPPTTTTSTYLSNSFIHDIGTHDYTENLNLFPTTTVTTTITPSTATNKDKSCSKSRISNNQQIYPINNNTNNISNNHINNNNNNNSNNKKRKKHNGDTNTNLPGFVDFSFFSMPGTINSPILPDDFHTHTGFLPTPTTQLYPCKNPLYTKQNDLTASTLLPPPLPPVSSGNINNNHNNNNGGNSNRSNIQHPEISPSINSVGTSLTNFNLSTIFPEINNKGVLSEPYLESRIKDHTTRNYNTTAQVSFNDKPTFSFSYINSTPQSYNNQ